jgi:RHS repeat-associated protein
MTGPSVTASFAYDGLGRRAQKTVNSLVTQFLYDGLDVAKENSGGSDVAYLRTLGIDEALVRTDALDTAHYLGDALGSSVALTTPGSTAATTYSYEPFGRTETGGGPSANAFRFTGREDDGTGLYYYRARYYDPLRSRFVGEDPIGLAGGSNVFTYGENNPVLFTDPSGLAVLIKPTWPNGNLRPGVYRQDGECTLPGPVAGPLNKNKCTKKCCQEHDECYAKYGCNASSWGRTLLGLPSACYMCNHRVVDCLLRDLGRTECGCEK